MQRCPRVVAIGLALSALLTGAAAGAQSLTDAERSARADLLARAQAAQREGRLDEALQYIERAERIGPTAGSRLLTARVQRDAGRPVEALASADRCLREVDVDAQTTASNRDALRRACADVRAEVAPRVGQLTVRVPADAPAGLEVSVGGAALPRAEYNAPRRVVAGVLRVRAVLPGRDPWAGEVTVLGGESASIDVRVPPTPGAAAPSLDAAASSGRATFVRAPRPDPATETPVAVAVTPPPPPAGDDAPPSAGGTQRALGVVGLVLGGVGLAAGAVSGGVLSSMSDTYAANRCAYQQAPSASCGDDYGTMDTLHTLQWAGYIGGGVLAAAGLVVFLTAPSRAPAVQVSLAPGGASIAYGGSF